MPDVTSPGGVDVRELGQLLQKRRSTASKSLRQVVDDMDRALTASTLQRIEKGAIPEPQNVPIIAAWLGIPTDMIRWPEGTEIPDSASVPDIVEVHLRADKTLGHAEALALSETFRTLYDRIVSGSNVPLVNKPKRR